MPDSEPGPGSEPAAEPEESTGRSRLWTALVRPSRGQVVVAVLLALVGFGAVTQVRANDSDDSYAGLRQQDLIDLLNGLAGTSQRAQDEIARLQSTRDDLLSDTSARQAALQQARQQADTLAVLDGTVPVRGPGIEITLRETFGRIQAVTFLTMVEALRTAGAEAMSVRDADSAVRVVGRTPFADGSDDGLLVGGRSMTAPVTVQVIGDPTALGSALKFPDGPQDQLGTDGVDLSWVDRTTLTITAVQPPTGADDSGAAQ